MYFRKDTDIALRLLAFYAKQHQAGDDFIYRREVLRETGLNAESQARICRSLVNGGLLEANPSGRSVGYRLAVSPEKISLMSIVMITEGSTDLLKLCDKRVEIYANKTWKKLQQKLDSKLEEITLVDLIERTRLSKESG